MAWPTGADLWLFLHLRARKYLRVVPLGSREGAGISPVSAMVESQGPGEPTEKMSDNSKNHVVIMGPAIGFDGSLIS